jgi:outer membrane biosynthesis protein TonB
VLGGAAAAAGTAALDEACEGGDADACAARAAVGEDAEVWRAKACALGDRPSCNRAAIERARADQLSASIATARADGPATEPEERRGGPRVWLQHIGVLDGRVASTGEIEPRFRNGLHRTYERCYRTLARQEDPPGGTVHIEWTFEAGGKVGDVRVTQSFAPEIDACLARTTASWTFPALAPDRGARVVLTAVFEP